jgi:aryl-alcohol dehydrogenase-like predicted oxidoreductase
MGKIRQVGACNVDADQMAEFEKSHSHAGLQSSDHLFRCDIEEVILTYCKNTS